MRKTINTIRKEGSLFIIRPILVLDKGGPRRSINIKEKERAVKAREKTINTTKKEGPLSIIKSLLVIEGSPPNTQVL
jgi:hypothetical protein